MKPKYLIKDVRLFSPITADNTNWEKEYNDMLQSVEQYTTELQQQRTEAQELILDMFVQACSITNKKTGLIEYDHCCISTYENAQDYLIKARLIEAKDCSRE